MARTMAFFRPAALSPKVLEIARATGSIMTVAVVLDIHLDTKPTAMMNPRIRVVGFLPTLLTSQEVKADHFNEIKLLGSANISYHQDTRSHVEIHGSDNIIPLVETYVDGNTLMIKFKKNVSIWKGKLEIKVFAPELNKLSINGSGNIKLINGIQTSKDIEFHINGSGNIQGEGLNCRRMAVSINGSGDVRLQQIESQECQAGISGSGNINLKGKAIQAKYAIAGSGNIQAADLEAENTDASISGSGNISCYASQKLVARVKGSGDIAYKGNPQEVDAPRKNIRQIK